MNTFPIPVGADAISRKAIKALEKKLGHMTFSNAEVQFIIDGVMKAQRPRDLERIEMEREKKRQVEERRRELQLARRRSYHGHA